MELYHPLVEAFLEHLDAQCNQTKPPLVARFMHNEEQKCYNHSKPFGLCSITRKFLLVVNNSHNSHFEIQVAYLPDNTTLEMRIMERIEEFVLPSWRVHTQYNHFPFNHPLVTKNQACIIRCLKKWLNIPYVRPDTMLDNYNLDRFSTSDRFLDMLEEEERMYREFVLKRHYNSPYKNKEDNKTHFLFKLTPELFKLVLSKDIHPCMPREYGDDISVYYTHDSNGI